VSKKRLVVGNWKMYVESPDAAKKFAAALRRKARAFVGTEAWLAPAFPLISPVAATLKGSVLKVGAQTISIHAEGAHTGDVSAKMLKGLGVSFVIVGHSERRATRDSEGNIKQGETDEDVRAQLAAALGAGLTAILCVGELERQPDGSHFQEIANQIHRALNGVPAPAGRLIVAYEPVWAIGKSATEAMQGEDLEETAIFIRKILSEALGREAVAKVPILYGGSVEPANAQALIKEGGVNGFLVGHASTEVDSFIDILKACKK
jgi:triosephosphate isomerase